MSLLDASEGSRGCRTGLVLIVGGTGGLGRELAARYRERGAEVIITGRDAERASAVAAEIGEGSPGSASI